MLIFNDIYHKFKFINEHPVGAELAALALLGPPQILYTYYGYWSSMMGLLILGVNTVDSFDFHLHPGFLLLTR